MNKESEEYITGYKDGFGDGWDAAKKTAQDQLIKKTKSYKFSEGCTVCGIGVNGEPLGYACQLPDCPNRITFYEGNP